MLYVIIIYIFSIGLLEIYVWYKKEPVDKIKKLIWENGLYLSIIEFEEYINKECRYNNLIQNKDFFKKAIKYTKNLEDFILKPVNINQIYGWDINQCFHVLEFIKNGIRLSSNAQRAQDRLNAKIYSSMLSDQRIVLEENNKPIKVLLEPCILEIVVLISIKTEERLEFLMDRLYKEALNSGDFEKAMEIRISKACCLYLILDIWSRYEFNDFLYSPEDELEIIKLTGRFPDYGYMQKKTSDIVSGKKYEKYFT